LTDSFVVRRATVRTGGASLRCSSMWVRGLSCMLAAATLVGSAPSAEEPAFTGGLTSMTLPGGIRGALTAIEDPSKPDRSQFLLDLIRRSHRTPIGATDPHDPLVKALVAHLDAASRNSTPAAGPADVVPLPLPPSIWIEHVFAGSVTPDALTRAIVASRSASLLYYGLFALDDRTRAWLAGNPVLVGEIAARLAAPFVLASPGLRVADGAVQVPGGSDAVASWEALVGRPVKQPADFVRALLLEHAGTLAYFYGAIGQLSEPHIRIALNLDAGDPGARVAAAVRLLEVFRRIATGWTVETRTFWRPALDPALLIAELPLDETGRARLPASREFWDDVFADDARRRTGTESSRPAEVRLDFAWLADRVFQDEPVDHRRRYNQVLFASRVVSPRATEMDANSVAATRAAGTFPALVTVLERMGITDPAVYARAGARALRLSASDDDVRALRAITQFQAAVALLARASARGSIPAEKLAGELSSLIEVDVNDHGEYAGRLLTWIDGHLRKGGAAAGDLSGWAIEPTGAATGPVEGDLIRVLAGAPDREPRIVEWEGTRYRVDLARAEALRITRLLGEASRPFLSLAHDLVTTADSFGAPGLSRPQITAGVEAIEAAGRQAGFDVEDEWDSVSIARYQALAGPLGRLKSSGSAGAAARLVPAIRELADVLAARGLLELAYAVALGQPDRTWIAAGDAARRHDFGLRTAGVRRRSAPWRLPTAGGDTMRGWRVIGSLLGLDVRLSEFSLVRLSTRPPARRPSLNEDQRRVFVEMVALVEPRRLTDDDRDALVAALRQGRERLAAMRTPADAAAVADATGLGQGRRGLLMWVLANDPARVPTFLSLTEIARLGLGSAPFEARFRPWGVPAEARLGCLCLQVVDRRPVESLTGRWGTGILATSFPDLNFRLGELLGDLHMPAALVAPVLASATLDLINTSINRDQDDRRGLLDFVAALDQARVEQYLALLTTDGPLVPLAVDEGISSKDEPAQPGPGRSIP
jgi:hypothetical protein